MTHATLHLDRSIDSSHVIPNHPGKCARLHGHTYRFQVWVSGPVDAASGMLVDYDVVKREIDAWDHRHLNDEVAFVPTAELLAAEMQRRILHSVKGIVGLDRSAQVGVLLRLWETPSSYAQVGFLTVDPEAAAHPHASAVVNSAPAGTDS